MDRIQQDSSQPLLTNMLSNGAAPCCPLHVKSMTFHKPEAHIYVQSYGQVVFLIHNTNGLLNAVVPHSREKQLISLYLKRLYSFQISAHLSAIKLN